MSPDTVNRRHTIMVVDDDESTRDVVAHLLNEEGYQIRSAENGRAALKAIQGELPDLILLDLEMPEMGGLETLRALKAQGAARAVPAIVLTGNTDRSSRLAALQAGAEDFLTKPMDGGELTMRVRNHLRLKDYGDFLREYSVSLERQVAERTAQLRYSYRETIYLLTSAAEFRDEDTGDHIRRVSSFTAEIARRLGMAEDFVDRIFYASPMHDIGKIAVPDRILLKPGPLDSEEWETMRKHTTLGRQILEKGAAEYIRMGAEIALTHHERWNGGGYPRGLAGEQIPITGSIMSICDTYDALRSRRPYKKPLAHEEAVRVIASGDGRTDPRHFRPEVLAAFQASEGQFGDIYEKDQGHGVPSRDGSFDSEKGMDRVGLVVALVGCLVLLSWLLGVPVLGTSMKALSAAGFLLSGAALWLVQESDGSNTRRVFERTAAALVLILGLLVLLEYLAAANPGIDELLAPDPHTAPQDFPGRMSLQSAVSFALVGAALLLVDVELRGRLRPAQWLAIGGAVISAAALAGYMYSVQSLYQVRTNSSISLPSSLLFCALSIGALHARPGRGLMSIASARTGGGRMLRRSIPLAAVSLLVLGWLQLWGLRAGLYDANLGVALFVLSAALVVTVIIWLNAGAIHSEEMQRVAAQEALEDANVKYGALVTQIPNSTTYVMTVGADVPPPYVSPQIEGLLGFPPREWMADHGFWLARLHAEDRGRASSARTAHMEKGEPFDETYRVISRDGRVVWVQDKAILVRDAQGRARYSQGIMIDIERRKEAEDAALRMNAELEERVRLRTAQLESANKELEAFSYSVSHDLRAPLRAIDGFSRMLEEDYGARLDAEGQRLLGTVRRGTRQMGSLIEDLLSFSQGGRNPLTVRRVAAADVAGEALAVLEGERRGRNVEMVIHELPECRADAKMLKQVFVNLLSNALKFTRTRDPARIEIGSLAPAGAEVTCFVKDNGVGFDMAYAGKLFGVFQRLHRSEEYEGTGVGLAFVQRIINRHGGRLWAEAEVGKGATFWFTLPAPEPGPRGERLALAEGSSLEERARGLI